jgi:RNA polymerase sigma factor (sigma-70 family)
MNVKELWAYRDAVRELNRASELLEEYEAIIYSPGGVRASGMPLDRSHDSPDRLATIVDKHDKLLIAEENARLKAHRAFSVLQAFEKTLPDGDVDVFRLRWLKGLTHREIGTELHRSERTVKRITNELKRKFAKFENVGTI